MKSFYVIFFGILFLASCNHQSDKTKEVQKNENSVKQSNQIVGYSQSKVSSMIRYMQYKQSFDVSGNEDEKKIKQTLVDLTSNRSITKPELPKLLLITGVLFSDIDNPTKAIEYYKLEIKMSDLSEKTTLEEALKQNWRRSKIEALILLNNIDELKKYGQQLKKKLRSDRYYELYKCMKFKKEDIYSSYSLKVQRNKDLGVVTL